MSGPPVVQLSRLFARDQHGAVLGLDLALPAGILGVLIGTPQDGTTALASTLAGLRNPDRGRVLVAGVAPRSSRLVRAKIGALLDEPELPGTGTVRELFALARTLRGEEADRDTWYEALRLSAVERSLVAGLGPAERRTVALGLALAIRNPLLLVLVEPLCVQGADADRLMHVLRARAREGACVLALTASVRDAVALGDDVATLEKGHVGRAIGAPDADAVVHDKLVELRVSTSDNRRVAAALAQEQAVLGLSWSTSELELAILCSDPESCARAVWRVTKACEAEVLQMRARLPGLEAIRSSAAPARKEGA